MYKLKKLYLQLCGGQSLKKQLTAIDLFCGAGGFTEGLKKAGFCSVAGIDNHPHPLLTYKKNHPESMAIEKDIRDITKNFVVSKIPAIKKRSNDTFLLDLIVGGPPCQGFSSAGKGKLDDPRNHLVIEFFRVVNELKPKFFIFENVPMIKVKNGIRVKIWDEIVDYLDEMPYNWRDFILNASDFNVPQKRKRLFIIGCHEKLDNLIKDLKFTKTFKKKKITVKDAISDLEYNGKGGEFTKYPSEPKNEWQEERRNGSETLFNFFIPKHKSKTLKMFRSVKKGQLMRVNGKKGTTRWDGSKLSPTITGQPYDFIHYKSDRVPAPRELARLQSFDDTYEFLGPRTSGGSNRNIQISIDRQIGNAVAPLQAKGLGESIRRLLIDEF